MNPAKILLVDDSQLIMDAVGKRLRTSGYEVVTSSPELAWMMIREQEPDLILLDVEMPEISGDQLAALFEKVEKRLFDRILFHSSRPGSELEALVKQTGVRGYIEKGQDPQAFLDEVARWVGGTTPPA